MRTIIAIVAVFASIVTSFAAGETYRDLYRQGVEANKKGDLDQAVALYTKAIALKGDSPELYYVRGRALKQKDRLDDAVRDFDRAIKLKPGYADAWNLRGATYIGLGKKEKSLADFKKACDLGSPDGCLNLKKFGGK